MEYRYRGVNGKGKNVRGRVRAENQWRLIAQLKNEDIYCTEYKEINNRMFFQRKISKKDLGLFSKIMKNNLKAGIPLITSLELVSVKNSNKVLAKYVEVIINHIKKGSTLEEALSTGEKGFPKFFIMMVRVGEESGRLQQIFKFMEKYYVNEHRRNKKIRGMLVYPTFVVAVASIMGIVIIANMLPSFFKTMNIKFDDLPSVTKFYMTISNTVSKLNLLIVPWVLSVIIGVYLLYQYLNKKSIIDDLMYKIPLIRGFQLERFYCRFTLSLSMMISSGLDIRSGLVTLKECENVDYISRKLSECINTVEQGQGFYDGMKKMNIFPEYFLTMIFMGEENGSLEESLITSNEEFEEDFQMNIEKRMKLIEPIIMLLAGIFVGSIFMAVMMPLFDMYNMDF